MDKTQAAPNPAEVYDTFLVPALFAPWVDELLVRAAPRAGERVLDVACGTGAVTLRLPPLVGPTGRVVGLDVSADMLGVAQAKAEAAGLAVEWREASALELPFGDGSFDLVLCQQGLQFFPDRARGAAEMRRVLAPGGRAVVACWLGLEAQPIYRALSAAAERHMGAPIAAPFSLGRAEELRATLEGAGFGRVEIEAVSKTVRFSDPGRFVALSVGAAAAVMPAFAQLDPAEKGRLVERVREDVEPVLREHTDGEALAMPTHAHIAVAFV